MNPLLLSKQRGIMVGATVQSGQTITLTSAEANTINYGVLAGLGAGVIATVIAMKVLK
jgi:hypothetical protein